MKIKTAAIIFFLIVSIVSGIGLTPKAPVVSAVNTNNTAVVSVKLPEAVDENEIFSARFLNMLNHNLVYGDAFCSVDEIVELSTAALYKSADDENPDFVNEDIVFSFVNDMYGIEVLDASALNPQFPQKQGYIYIVPRGFTVYNHTNPEISFNEDGTVTVTTDIEIYSHDAEEQSFTAISMFRVNEASSFGYSIVYSEIIEAAAQM